MGDLLESVEAYDLGDLKVNNRFASNYNLSERAKELVRSKDLLKDADDGNSVSQGDSDSESETEDDDAEMLSTELDLKIIRTINSLRKKDPSIYDSTTRWFEAETTTEASPVTSMPKDAKKKRFKDVAREQLLSTGGDEDEVELSKNAGRSGAIAYDDEQRQLRKAFLQSANDSLVDDEAEEEASGILAVKASTTSAPPKILELRAALNEMKQLGLQQSTGRVETGKTALLELQDETEREEFLENYFSKALWKADRQFEPGNIIIRGEVDQSDAPLASDCDTEDGEEVEKMEKFESKYNFRFEELQQKHMNSDEVEGGGQSSYHVVGHVRNTQGSLRRVDDKRKVERERRRERKETERRQQEAELRRLKNLKRQEVGR